jgi:hypothetical protein
MGPNSEDVLPNAEIRRLTNPTDHLGRKPEEIQWLRENGLDPGDVLCPECLSAMELRGGGGRTLHLYHTRGDANRSCFGAHETAWHLFCKSAAKRSGWSTETTVRLPCGVRRADAYRDGEFLEFVHSQSPTYVTKHRQLSENGIKCRWVVDSAASFHSPFGSESFDFGDRCLGPLRVKGLLKPKVASLLVSIGPENCFVYYRWAVWQCVGYDEWELLPQGHELQQWCTRDGGLNNEIVVGNARSAEHGYRVHVRPGEFRTNWNTQVEYLFQELLCCRSRLADEARRVISERYAREQGGCSVSGYIAKDPACKGERPSRYLSREQIHKIVSESAGVIAIANRDSVPFKGPNLGNVRDSAALVNGGESRASAVWPCASGNPHSYVDVRDGDFVATLCKWCGKFYGKRPVATLGRSESQLRFA